MLEFSNSIKDKIFSITSEEGFIKLALQVFRFQAENSIVYKEYLDLIKCNPNSVNSITEIPFLPIQFFKSFTILSNQSKPLKVFKSSGTTANGRSQHFVTDLSIYEASFTQGFNYFYGDITEYTVLALLPNYIEQGESSLIYMVDKLIQFSNNSKSGYCLTKIEETISLLEQLKAAHKKVLLIGVSYALLDLIAIKKIELNDSFIIMETGGMKGRRKELTKEELHNKLKIGFGVSNIHSEYGMTELLSQAYATDSGKFKTPPWMKVSIRDINDPLAFQTKNKAGGLNIIDLANVNSCSFIATQDLGRLNKEDQSFEILGRFDNSDLRGCNQLITD